jgi:predicted methyltransferase
MYKIILRATELAHNAIKPLIRENDVVIDATLGNGYDTIFLSELVPQGKVYSFDIQKSAIEKVEDHIKLNHINNVVLINDGHEKMDEYINEKPMAIMFNLGYLPGGDKEITTMPDTTVDAVQKGLEMLHPGGVMTIEVYTGHNTGEDEARKLEDYIKNLSAKEFSVMKINFLNKNRKAPFLIIIEKFDKCCEDKQSNPCLM